MEKIILRSAAAIVLVTGFNSSANAALINSSTLNFNTGITECDAITGACTLNVGSYFAMDINDSGTVTDFEKSALTQNDGVTLGASQAATSHSGPPDGSEVAGIDAPWIFKNITGLHLTNSNTNVLSAAGNTATINFSGWGLTWNGISFINMGSGAWNANANGIAMVTCGLDCGDGDTYILDYSATVPIDDTSGFGGVKYALHLEGTVSAVPLPAAVWLFGSGLIGLAGLARRKKA